MNRTVVILILGVTALAIFGVALYLATRVSHDPAPASAPRALIDCRNFPEAATCAAGVADFTGTIVGQAEFCSLPQASIAGLREALQVALPVISLATEPYLESGWLARDAERRALSRARFRVLPTDCAKVAKEFRELLMELGVRAFMPQTGQDGDAS